jgi:hypothetical protein
VYALHVQGGLSALTGILRFPDGRCYSSLKTLATGCLLRITAEPDVRVLALQLGLQDGLLSAVASPCATVYLRVLAAGALLCLAQVCMYTETTLHVMYLQTSIARTSVTVKPVYQCK